GAARTERKDARTGENITTMPPAFVHADIGQVVVVEPCARKLAMFQRKAERLDQVQGRTSVGGEPDDVARIGRDFRLEQDDMEHFIRYAASARSGDSRFLQHPPRAAPGRAP